MLLVLGKGGVGRTTTTALLAHGAHAAGLNVLVVAIDGKSSLHRLCPGGVDVRSVTAGSALEDYLLDQGFGNFARRLAQSGVIEVVGAAAPGIHDLVVLGKVKQFANIGQHDVVILDAPATGHATSMLSSVSGVRFVNRPSMFSGCSWMLVDVARWSSPRQKRLQLTSRSS